MIEYGLRIAAERPGRIQKRGVKALRSYMDKKSYEDPPLDTDVSSLPILDSVPADQKAEAVRMFSYALGLSQELGPIRRALVFASAIRPVGNLARESAISLELAQTKSVLEALIAKGFVDKDPEPRA